MAEPVRGEMERAVSSTCSQSGPEGVSVTDKEIEGATRSTGRCWCDEEDPLAQVGVLALSSKR
jgi:hypothetical protein